jgi:predicted AAA+ superfamily ATPase
MSEPAVKVVLTDNVVTQDPAPRERRVVETDQFGAFARRILRAYARRVGDRDIEALTGLVALRDEVDAAIAEAVKSLHGNPYSWAEIARVLGVSKQAVHERFATRV